jgi:cellulose synthase/poly-beta-1,6-N-acetylglucosamine synthase-like glycosyltransferase
MQRAMIEQGRDYRVEFVPDAVCWTEAPESLKVLRRQRTRWQRGLYDTLSRHRTMLFNPRYGTLGTLALPYFLLFELLGPAMEGLAVILTLVMWAAGMLNTGLAPFMLAIMIGLGLVLSISSLVLEETVFHKYPKWKHVLRFVMLSLVETIGYRQLNSWWRIQGLWQAFRKQNAWGTMTRTGAAAGERQSFGGGRYWSLRAQVETRMAARFGVPETTTADDVVDVGDEPVAAEPVGARG